MAIRRVRAVQAHPVPEHAYYSGGLFDPEVMASPKRGPDHEEDPWEFPPGATVLNGMKGVPLYRCTFCDGVVAESEFDAHQCGYSQTEDPDE